MRDVARRITRLESRLAPPRGDRLLVVLSHAGWGLALNEDRCIEIRCAHRRSSREIATDNARYRRFASGDANGKLRKFSNSGHGCAQMDGK